MAKRIKIICTSLLLIAIVFSLCACGNSSSSSSVTTEEPESYNEVNGTYEEGETLAETEELYESEDEYENEISESEDTYEVELNGIIYIYRPFQSETVYAGGKTEPVYDTDGTIQIWTLNPDTGECQLAREFPRSLEYKENDPYNSTMNTNNFDTNYERMATQEVQEDGSTHVGWIDQSGRFTDVTAQITTPGGDFSGLVSQYIGRFGPDNYYYFQDDNGKHRVPLDNLTSEAVEDIGSNDIALMWPDGSLRIGESKNAYYSDSSMSYPLEGNILRSKSNVRQWPAWINQEEYVCTQIKKGTYSDYTITLGNVADGSYSEIIPDINDRWSYNPVVSPDDTQVAFLSSLRAGNDNAGYVFIADLTGSEPRKVDTDLSFACFMDLEGSFHLMEWR